MNRRTTTTRPPTNPSTPKPGITGRRGGPKGSSGACKHKQVVSANVLFLLCLLIIAAVYGLTVFAFYEVETKPKTTNNNDNDPNNKLGPNQLEEQRRMAALRGASDKQDNNNDKDANDQYSYWRNLAVRLAALPADELLKELKEKDPFGTHHFEQALLEQETALGRLLEPHEIEALFPCPSSRITLPDQRNLQKGKDFRDNKSGTFLFFQHLRKAGGTHFCSLAKANLPKNNVAAYYCMPDMKWSGGKHAGYLHSYSNEEMIQRMAEEHQRIAGNEWDWFDVEHHFDLPAVTATSFRKPLDRALSQFRFECVEDRGCKGLTVEQFWDRREDLYNVYTQTFADTPKTFRKLKQVYEDKVPDAAQKRSELVGRALDTVAKFNLVLSMEFLAYAGPQVDRVLSFHDTSPLTKRVRPHIQQRARDDGQENNSLGAAGITKASWDPEKYLEPAQFQKMSKHLALDMILTDAARRIFLERLVCKDLSE